MKEFHFRGMKDNMKKDRNVPFRIRLMEIEDIPQVVELARPHHFNFTASTLKFWQMQDPDGMTIAVTESGQIIASLFTVKISENLCTGGMYCVHENYRHLDIGRKLVQESMAQSQHRNIVGNVVVQHIESFQRIGVGILETEWNSLEYETDTAVNPSILSDELPSGVEILPFQNSLLPAIFEYDYSLIGFDRRPIIEASCKEENSKTLVAMKDGKCIGLGSIKLNIIEYGKIGPLYADDPFTAEAMAKRLIMEMPEAKGFCLATINTNIFANMILDKLSLPVYKSFYRLYSKKRLDADTKKVFAHLDLDFSPF
ncbi:UNVERIFIED_CONTAM: hypothetical protein NCL1_18721 [Trichonephila clavipes]